MWGKLNEEQRITLRPFVKGQEVWDLGAGDYSKSIELVTLGAQSVNAVDCIRRRTTALDGLPIRVIEAAFSEVEVPSGSVAFISWPEQYTTGLAALLEDVDCVIYLGTNFNGTACGSDNLWEALTQRECLAYVNAAPANSLIVYGKERVQRKPLPEEEAALDNENVRWA